MFKRSYISNFKTKTFYLPCLKSNLKHVLFLNVHRSFTTSREKPPAVISVPKVVMLQLSLELRIWDLSLSFWHIKRRLKLENLTFTITISEWQFSNFFVRAHRNGATFTTTTLGE